MKTIKNKTPKPLSVPLPRGKRLFLSPGKTGQIASKAADHPPLVALVEAGELEIIGEGASVASRNTSTGPNISAGPGHSPGKSIFRSGDR